MTDMPDDVVRQEIVVRAPRERAFHTVVERFGDIKPRSHNLLDVDIAETVFVPRVANSSEVEVEPGVTRVDLEHRNLERHGADGRQVRDGVTGDRGWPLYLAHYAARL